MTVAAVSRALMLLEVLAGEQEPLELAELARRLAMPASATHRLLSTLVAHGWAVQDMSSQKYALSLRLCTLAFRNLDVRNVPEIVQAELDALALATREYCRLALVEGDDLIWVARAQGAVTGLRYEPELDHEIILHATANGKAWLACMPEDTALALVKRRGFKTHHKLGPNSARTIDQVRERLRQTRAQGYATSIEEAEPGTGAIAVTFRSGPSPDAPVAGTISVAAPLLRMPTERLPELARALHATAEKISALWPLRERQRGITVSARRLLPATGHRLTEALAS